MDVILGILAAGVAVALFATVGGLALLGLIIWAGITVVNRITGRTDRQKNLPAGSAPLAKRGHAHERVTYAVPQHRASERASGHMSSSSRQAARSAAATASAPASTPFSAPRDYEYLDVDAGATAEVVTKAMQPYEGAPYMGEFARSVISALGKADFRYDGLVAAIGRQFDKRTITWEKFMTPVDVAMDGILRNCTQIANRVQGFDIPEYERLLRLKNAGAFEEGSNDQRRLDLFENTIDEMRDLRKANEDLLFELEKLQGELDKLSDKDDGAPNDDILEEIRKLSDDAKYYSQ
ncbi:MAG: hypothetical protein IKG21_02060 [Atopobiaceae bacterium]|nr:hypothetical protein [Atopobiaceae bacterium]